jgi:hypothetical protein
MLRPITVATALVLLAAGCGTKGFPTLADARHLRSPALYVGTTEDGYTTFGAETRTLFRATRARGSRLLLVPGSEHGTGILKSPNAQRVIRAVATFVRTEGQGRHPRSR